MRLEDPLGLGADSVEIGRIEQERSKRGTVCWDGTAHMLTSSDKALNSCSAPQGIPYGSGGVVGQVRDAIAEEPARVCDSDVCFGGKVRGVPQASGHG